MSLGTTDGGPPAGSAVASITAAVTPQDHQQRTAGHRHEPGPDIAAGWSTCPGCGHLARPGRHDAGRRPCSPDVGMNGPTLLRRLANLLGRLDPVRLAAVVSLLPVELLLAVRIGVDVALDRADRRSAELVGADYPGGRWHRAHRLPELGALQRRRWPPTGDRDLWIRYGPAGPPQSHTGQKAAG